MPAKFCHHWATDADADRAVKDLVDRIGSDQPAALFLFVEPDYDLDQLAQALRKRIDGPVLACTTAGGLTRHGYVTGGFVAASICSDQLTVRTAFIDQVNSFDAQAAQRIVAGLELERGGSAPAPGRFGILLIDGMSRSEERVAALLHGATNGLPTIGGSAGDNCRFEQTLIFDGKQFQPNAALLGVIETELPHLTFRFQHFSEGPVRAVVTDADPASRRILTINGEPAVEGYKRLIGRDELSPSLVAKHPLMLKASDNENYARSIRNWDDGVLTLYCAIERGMVVRTGVANDLVATLEEQLAGLRPAGRDPGLIISFDCILRRLEVQTQAEDERLARAVAGYPLIGFSTYGEQFNGTHINQTMTGFCLAE